MSTITTRGIIPFVQDFVPLHMPTRPISQLHETNLDSCSSTIPVKSLAGAQPWLSEAMAELRDMEKLTDDWHSCGASPPNAIARQSAAMLLSTLSDLRLKPSRIEPSTGESVCIAFENGDKYADIECYNSGEMIALISDGQSRRDIWEVFQANLLPAVDEISAFIAE